MKKELFIIALLGVAFAGCDSDSGTISNIYTDPCAKCSSDQVCVNQTCYDSDDPCASCSSEQVCVDKTCYNADEPCAKCSPDQTCVKDTCLDINDPCAKCTSKQTCYNNKCVSNNSPCLKCQKNEVCVNDVCYNTGHPCSKCSENEVCYKEKCYEAGDPCLKCNDTEICENHECKEPQNPCDACLPSDTCENGTCIPCATTVCGEECCYPGDVCHPNHDFCTTACADGRGLCGYECCAEDMFCAVGDFCDRNCEFGLSCGPDKVCCNENEQCYQGNYCAPKCDEPQVLCGEEQHEVCCALGQVCVKNECHTDCAANTTRCGADQNLCCDNATQICIFNKCLPKGKTCEKTEDCELWEFCDLDGSKTCVSQDENDNKCVYRPTFEKFDPVVKWHYKATVEGTPAVADMTGDGIPDVVFETESYELVALDGDTGNVLATTKSHVWHPWGDLALADIDGDGVVEAMVSTGETGTGKSGMGILSLEQKDGKWNWKEESFLKIKDDLLKNNVSSSRYYTDIHPAVADIDADTIPEIVTAVGVVKGNDLTKWQCELNLPSYTTWYRYGIVIADLDQDGQSELIADKIYDNNCKVLAEIPEGSWGFPAVANVVPNNGKPGELIPEIVRVKSISKETGYVSAWKVYKNNGVWTQEKVWEQTHPGGGGGHPNIADFDGDTKAEIGIAGGSAYAVFKGETGEVMWNKTTQDFSSYRTGSSVFDFEGDGKAEVVYRDECYLRVYDGKTGDVIMEEPVTSGTVIDYPIIVDVDADGKTEIVTTSASHSCSYPAGKSAIGAGVIVYKDSHSKWVRTRKVWNQHSYHVTNINEDGSVPVNESANWLNKRLNNYRANTQPDDAFNAPNLTPGDLKVEQNCPNYKMTATIKNEGSSSARNVWVSFYIRGYDAGDGKTDDLLLGSVQIKETIQPGSSVDISYDWDGSGTLVSSGTKVDFAKAPLKISFSVDDAPDKSTADFYNECVEDDNDSEAKSVEVCVGEIN